MSREEYSKKHYSDNSDRIKERTKKHYHDNKDSYKKAAHARYERNKESILARNKIWRDANKDRISKTGREYHLRKVYGISLYDYNNLLASQNNRCAICLKTEDEIVGKFHIDHSHTDSKYIPSNVIRGILCGLCNQSLIGDRTDPEIFLRAYEYLKRHTGVKMPNAK